MTTTTLPAGLDVDADLEAWLRGETEKPCEVWIHPARGLLGVSIPCGKRANWLAYARPQCHHGTYARLLCDQHKDEAAAGTVACGYATPACTRPVTVTWVEPIRSTP